MKYLCLIYADEKRLDAMSGSEWDAFWRECTACDQALRQSGSRIAAAALQSVRTATTVRVRQGRLSTTDGPFAETKEQLGGFVLIEAHDLDDALRVAALLPPARIGSVEVRPVRELDLS
ncbi:MAG: YciI family protein [Dongiaceae bacterium]